MENQIGNLTGTIRTATGKGSARKLRVKGQVPGIIYGQGSNSQMIAIDPSLMLKAVDPKRQQNTVFTIDLEGKKEKVMLKEIQRDTLTNKILHIDFVRVTDETVIRTKVPMRVEGRPEAVTMGGKIKPVFRALPVSCKASEIPLDLVIDVQTMKMGTTRSIKDITVPEGVTLLLPEKQTVVSLSIPRGVDSEEESAEEGAEGTEGEGAEAAAAPAAESK